MNGFYKYTPFRVTVPFISGIVFMLYSSIEIPSRLFLLIAFICFSLLIISYIVLRSDYNYRWISGFIAGIALFSIGALMVACIKERKIALDDKAAAIKSDALLCRIETRPVEKSGRYSGSAGSLAFLDSTGNWNPFRANVMLYFKDDSTCRSLEYGDLIIINGMMQTISGPPNPFMFNFSKYMENRQVYRQVFIDKDRWELVGRTAVNPIYLLADRCRTAFLETFRRFGITGQDFALVSALLLGSSEYLDSEIRQEFSYAGATHVLSVSGLHVGIVYIAADKMLFFLKRKRKSRHLHTFLTILCIWFYALITGLSTSVTRASLMFSLVAAGNLLKRSSENFNILAAAAFLQLWINPYEITLVGFQLSYMAVMGIFAFYRPFNEMIETDNRVISWLWPIMAVSLAAQLSTSPLSCYYFNIFPVYFLLTNLVVVPLAGLIIYFAIFLLFVGAIGITVHWIALPLQWSLWFMRESISMIQSWPGAVIEPIVLNSLQVILIYLIIISLFGLFVINERKWALVIFISCLVYICLTIVDHYQTLKTNEVIVYQVPGNTAADLISRRNAVFIGDSLLIYDQKKINQYMRPNRIHNRIKEVLAINIKEKTGHSSAGIWINLPFIFFQGKRIVFINEQLTRRSMENPLAIDLVIFSGSTLIHPGQLSTMFNIKQAVIDSSVPAYQAASLICYYEKEGIPCHWVKKAGSFVMKW